MRVSERVKPKLSNLPLINEDDEGEDQPGIGPFDCLLLVSGDFCFWLLSLQISSWSYKLRTSSHNMFWEVTIKNLNMQIFEPAISFQELILKKYSHILMKSRRSAAMSAIAKNWNHFTVFIKNAEKK